MRSAIAHTVLLGLVLAATALPARAIDQLSLQDYNLRILPTESNWIYSAAHKINRAGQILGGCGIVDSEGNNIGASVVLWEPDGSYTEIETTPGVTGVFVGALNDNGVIVGALHSRTATTIEYQSFIWHKDSGISLIPAPNADDWNVASAINNAGLVAGDFTGPTGQVRPYMWTDGAPRATDLSKLPRGHLAWAPKRHQRSWRYGRI